MEKISQEELNVILDKHKLWLNDENDGKRADLHNTDCSGLDFSNNDLRCISLYNCNLTKANLSNCNLTDAFLIYSNLEEVCLIGSNLTGCDLSGVKLEEADLTGAILKNARLKYVDLTNTKGLITTENYIKNNFEFDIENDGYIVYKTFGSIYDPPDYWIIKENSIIKEKCNMNRRRNCSNGINCGTLDWVRNYNKKYNLPIWKLLIKKEWLKGVVVPYATDGKIRCNKAMLLNIVE